MLPYITSALATDHFRVGVIVDVGILVDSSS